MFSLPPTLDGAEGGDDEHPIKLSDPKHEFERLLDFFYQGMRWVSNKNLRPEIVTLPNNVRDWINLLIIADRYMFTAVKKHAIEQIEAFPLSYGGMNTADKLHLALKYNIPKWKLSAFEELCERKDCISLEEASAMGMENFVLLTRMREEVRLQGWASSNPGSSNQDIIKAVVKSVLGLGPAAKSEARGITQDSVWRPPMPRTKRLNQ
ncbi:hypothetical protein H0H92_001021 [Tricholoma furcatifolium]|nr:hypothetical protein H0H92_001021 [Tricholoma furcatifolium]